MKILVVGAGAVGGYFGGRLAQAGRDVTFLVRPRRRARLQSVGLRIKSTLGDLAFYPKTVCAPDLTPDFDLILLSVKGYALDQAIEDLAPAVGPRTMILPALNGMTHLTALAAGFGDTPVLGGVSHLIAQLDEDGTIVQSGALQRLRFGELDGVISDRILSVNETLAAAGFEAGVSPRIRQEMWEKWVQLASFCTLNCLMRSPLGAIARTDGGVATVDAVLEESFTTAAAHGFAPSEAFAAQIRALATQTESTVTTSMYRDMIGGKPVEVEQILGDFVRRAKTKGIRTPLLTAAMTNLQIYAANLDTLSFV